MKEDRALSDRELADKYEAGAINLAKMLQKVILDPQLLNKKKNSNSKNKNKQISPD